MENELNDILRQITELESQIAIKKNTTEQLQTEVNSKKIEEQTELDEVTRLQACQQSMKAKLSMKQQELEQVNAKESMDNLLNDLGGMLR